jgi:DNA-directed RNA polymerase subunit L
VFGNMIDRLRHIIGLLNNDKYSAIKITKGEVNSSVVVEEETMTIGEILSHYCKIVDKRISYVSANIVDPGQYSFQIKMKHPDPTQILIQAAEIAIVDIEKLMGEMLSKLTLI